MKVEITIFQEEFTNSFSLMPTSIIYPEVDDLSFEPNDDPHEHFQKTGCVPFLGFHHPMESIDRIYPAKYIKSFLMLASGRYIGRGPLFSPHPAQLRMKAEAGLVFKKDDPLALAFEDEMEFFLTPPKTPAPLLPMPEHTDRSDASTNNPTSGSAAEHDGHGSLSGELDPDTRRPRRHPTDSWQSPPPWEAGKEPDPTPSSDPGQSAPVCLNGAYLVPPPDPFDSLSLSISPLHNALNQTAQQPGRISSLTKPVNSQQYGAQSVLQGSLQRFLKASLGLYLYGLW
nr:hypothetical protein [Candidatus Hakubella thermalkaliphila]